jgi:hypothetical protein
MTGTHPRQQLRAAFVQRLAGVTAAGDRVHSGRLMPIEEPELPAIIVHTRDTEEVQSRSISGWNGYEQRRCTVSVICVAQSFDDIDTDLDSMAADVEAALQSWIIPGFESAEIGPHSTSSEDPEFDGSLSTGAITLKFPVTYLTPFRDGPNPYVIDGDDPLGQSGAYPGGRITPDGQTGETCPVAEATLFANQEEL